MRKRVCVVSNLSELFLAQKSDGQHFRKDKKIGVKVDQTKWKNGENLKEKCTKMHAIAE